MRLQGWLGLGYVIVDAAGCLPWRSRVLLAKTLGFVVKPSNGRLAKVVVSGERALRSPTLRVRIERCSRAWTVGAGVVVLGAHSHDGALAAA